MTLESPGRGPTSSLVCPFVQPEQLLILSVRRSLFGAGNVVAASDCLGPCRVGAGQALCILQALSCALTTHTAVLLSS